MELESMLEIFKLFVTHYIEKFTSIPCDKPLKMYYTNSEKCWLVFYDVVVSTNHMYIK
jgi:hypothetical protein